MRSHAPAGYDCPMCRLVAGASTEMSPAEAVFHRDEHTAALVSGMWWRASPGHVLVVPRRHVENIYALPDEVAGPLLRTVRLVAIALVELDRCEGTTLRQHNEPAGNQDVWHLHIHVYPRRTGDHLYTRTLETYYPSRADQIRRATALRDTVQRLLPDNKGDHSCPG